MRVRFAGFDHSPHYASATQPSWWSGEVREVSEIEAAYLVNTFGVAFEILPQNVVEFVAPEGPAVDRAMRSPRRAKRG